MKTDSSAETRKRAASRRGEAQTTISRQLMASLRPIMENTSPAAQKMATIAALVAQAVHAEACSCFVQRAGDLLELFAASGLTVGPAHKTRLRVGEGLVGDVAARAVCLSSADAQSHPGFTACPETGGLEFKSFCGVPILQGGLVRGVLVVQNRLQRSYEPEVVDLLQTVALVLAELITSGGVLTIDEMSAGISSGRQRPTEAEGVSLGRGLAIGHAVLYEPRLTMQNIIAEDSTAQKLRLRRAVAGMHEAINRMLHQDIVLTGSETRDILEAYQMFARDRGWLVRIEAAIDKSLSAEAAVIAVLNETRARMAQVSDGYIRERLQDMEELSNRLLSHLMQQHFASAHDKLPEDMILVARSMGPAALLDYDRARLKGVVLEKGSHSNHVAIVARSLGIPVVGQCGDVLNYIVPGDKMIVDGDHGVVYLRPSQPVIDLCVRSLESRSMRSSIYRRMQHQQSITKNGFKVAVQMNAGLLTEVEQVHSIGADGIGLFRTELSFMGWKKYPLVATQAELYSKVLGRMGDKPVVFRTLDIGGDKPLPYFKAPEEENPALGWRAVRIGMDRPAVLRTQFRAFIRGARGRNLKIMLPMVTEVAEYDRARQLLEMEKIRAVKNNMPLPEKIELGVMLEVPALLWQLDTLLQTVDFISVGTNDLMQYLYAADRGNDAIRNRYDVLSPAMLKILKMIADQCRAAGVPVSVCGEMAGLPLEAMVLISLGYDTLSVSSQAVETVKMMIPTLDTERLLPYLELLMKSREHSIRERLLSFARDHQVNIVQNI